MASSVDEELEGASGEDEAEADAEKKERKDGRWLDANFNPKVFFASPRKRVPRTGQRCSCRGGGSGAWHACVIPVSEADAMVREREKRETRVSLPF